jgi:hypothetical protein
MMQKLSILFFSALPFFVSGQDTLIRMGAGNSSERMMVAENVQASDGVYDKFVLIRWEASDKGDSYRLFRATSPKGASMLELTKSWQKSTWFCDYSAEPGRAYFYAVMESDGSKTEPLSPFDKGYIRKSDGMAIDESLSATIPDKYATGKTVFLLIADVFPSNSIVQAGENVSLRIGLQNIFDEAAPRTDLQVYLSSDVVWDFEDKLVLRKTYSGFPANFKGNLTENLTLPSDLVAGNYHLLVVAAPEGNILNAKIGSTTITIQSK